MFPFLLDEPARGRLRLHFLAGFLGLACGSVHAGELARPRDAKAVFEIIAKSALPLAWGEPIQLRWAGPNDWIGDAETQAFESALEPGARGSAVWARRDWADLAGADELAFVFAHEISHGLCQHRAKTVGAYAERSQAVGLGLKELAVDAAADLGFAFARASADRAMELEADRLGAALAARAGFNPIAGARAALGAGPQGHAHPQLQARLAAVASAALEDPATLARACQSREPGAY